MRWRAHDTCPWLPGWALRDTRCGWKYAIPDQGCRYRCRRLFLSRLSRPSCWGWGQDWGLSLCQEIVEGHGGTIRLAQAGPQGAVFRVTLPVEAPQGVVLDETPPEEVPTIRGKRVLVVDDELGIIGVVVGSWRWMGTWWRP